MDIKELEKNSRRFKIERGIKIPPKNPKKCTYPYANMQINDSFFVPNKKTMPSAYHAQKRTGFKFTVREWSENGKSGVRIWRIA